MSNKYTLIEIDDEKGVVTFKDIDPCVKTPLEAFETAQLIFNSKLEKIEQQNQILKEALSFYANDKSWESMDSWEFYDVINAEDLQIDHVKPYSGGKLARETLSKIKEME
jgi:hypothetical protein